ncbi:hypothetical protein ACI01nite_26050 [Acetobacter cibinongensis]|uniref:Uncharacterized protein n=1 Tax=Acetobacter cibinongensis TaxID=146475 RepID=A0A0D6N6W7_9PROT|nr:hypothetical protein Abci_024_004 [Acetobacter cibinongensis]GEL60003.1 hypothetical protein ACI01nite_26050 [Acetobacter cibinongensis]
MKQLGCNLQEIYRASNGVKVPERVTWKKIIYRSKQQAVRFDQNAEVFRLISVSSGQGCPSDL